MVKIYKGETLMALQSHIETLKLRHQELENQLSELMTTVSASDDDIVDVKRKKLQIKDKIEHLNKQDQLN